MGCDGCELWPTPAKVIAEIGKVLEKGSRQRREQIMATAKTVVNGRDTSEIYSAREEIANSICGGLNEPLPNNRANEIIDVIRRQCKCYAGMLGTFRGGQKGYAESFSTPKLFPGRMADAARWGVPTARDSVGKPWIKGLRRLIFVSDMGDALSNSISFKYLLQEIIANVASPSGQRHIWLWLSKRPGRMAEFGKWLEDSGSSWPRNLVAMTTITSQQFAPRIDELRKVPSRLRGLSIEPLSGPVNLDLTGIDWVIVGGGSDILADPFHVEWALDLQKQCEVSDIAFFFKQVGRNPYFGDVPLSYEDTHGGDWQEWPGEWRVRQFPKAFSASGQASEVDRICTSER